MYKVQDDLVIDRVLPDCGVLRILPSRQPPMSQNVHQSHPVIENEGDIQMPFCGIEIFPSRPY